LLGDIPRLGARVVKADGVEVAVFRTAADQVFALKDACPHRQGPLSQGIVHGDSVTCPLHNWKIDLASGEALGPDQGCANTYPAKIEDGAVLFKEGGSEAAVASGSTTINVLKMGLKGVRNFRAADGSEVPFTTTKQGSEVSDTFLSRIAPEHRRELANAITEGAHLGEEERGK